VMGDQAFPSAGYTDLAVAFISVWLDAILKVLAGQKNYVRVRFYHNPYSVDVSASEVGAARLEFIWHNGPIDQLIGSMPMRLRELLQQSMEAGERTLEVCEQRGWMDPDIQMLAANLKRGRKALRPLPGPVLS